jgi:DNA-binding transcriptional ArsR family regulator
LVQPQSVLSTPLSFLIENQTSETVFETQLSEAIDVILSALGDSTKEAIYRLLKKAYGINKEDIPNQIEGFANAIEQTFGPVSKLIEIKIIERLHAKYKDFSYAPKKGELNFVEFVYNLQHHLELEA